MTTKEINTIHPLDFWWHELFEQQVVRLPQQLAVICNHQQLTYDELNQKANQLAHYLRSLGAGAEVMIPICVERSVAMAVGILGILKAGAAFVPIDPMYPKDRIAFMLADTAAPIVVTESHLLNQFLPSNSQFVSLDTDWSEISKHSSENLQIQLEAENLSYLIYTSGSTGKPKGTMLTQRNLTHYVTALQSELQLTPQDCYLHLASIGFSSSRRHLLFPLAHGATVIIADEEQRMDPLPLFALIKKYQVTVFDAVPSFQRHCTNALLELAATQRDELLTNNLRLILSASEPLLSDIPNTWINEFRHPAQHIHMMGQTETSGIVALHRIQSSELDGQVKVVPIGRPIANTQIFLLDKNQQPVPLGEAGEMYISGAGVGRGYLHGRQFRVSDFAFRDSTSERSISNTQHSALSTQHSFPDTRFCRTGDYARWLPNGELECLGRQDFQVKIRGFRVELGEVEAFLMGHPDVRECAVIAREDVPNRKQLVAYIVPRSNLEKTLIEPRNPKPETRNSLFQELRELALRTLPDYMVPAAFVKIDSLPLTPNGKIDRKALPAPDANSFQIQASYFAPETPAEEIIAAIWAEVLGCEQVGRQEHFFSLGGHSLLASQVIARLRTAFHIELPLRAIFNAPTVAGLAEAVIQFQSNHLITNVPALLPMNQQAEIPLSFSQQRLWFLDQLEPGTATYNLSKIVRLKGNLEASRLRNALQSVVDRHEILRTSFVSENGQGRQIIAPAIQAELPLTDLSKFSYDYRQAEELRQITLMTEKPFDLTCNPLWRVNLIRLSESEHLLIIVFHHIISDGWSVSIFLNELGANYSQSSQLPDLSIQYADYACWQQESLQGEILDEQLRYWSDHLSGMPAFLELPTDKQRPARQQYRGAQISRLVPAKLLNELKSLSQQEGVTLFMTLLSAFQVLLMRYSGQEQVVVGTPIAGRLKTETESLIGFFVNTLALCGNLEGDPKFIELLQRTRERALGAYAHQEMPFEKLVEALQPERSLSYSPIFQVMFALQNAPDIGSHWNGISLSPVKLASTTAKFDLSLDVYEKSEGLEVWLEYDRDLFTAETAGRMLAQWGILLEGIIEDPAQEISRLPLLTKQEQQLILSNWNAPTVEVPQLCLHQLIEQQAARMPEAIAVSFDEKNITYSELNKRANFLAHHLRKFGVAPEAIVGLCVERSLEMVIGVLGILKAGGAYLPLDPNYPGERLGYMLADASVKVLLTQQHLRERLPDHLAQVIYLDDLGDKFQSENFDNQNLCVEVGADNLAYLIYTSGSTGQAKGVMVTHGNVVNAFVAWDEAYKLSSLKSHLQMASFSFDVFTGDFVRALGSGAKLVICPTDYLLEPDRLYDLMRKEKIDSAEFVPAVMRPLLEHLAENNLRLDFMRLVVVGSDTWQREEYRKLRSVCGAQTRVVNSYGVTEATIDSTYFESDDLSGEGMVPIGKPFANTRIYFLDRNQNIAPIGVAGELCIGGNGVTRGYLNRPKLTKEKFQILRTQDSALSTQHFLYFSGDLGRYLADGTIELLGRADAQVKLRGFRIELGEIEEALKRLPEINDAVVIVREDQPGDQRLVAYLVAPSKFQSAQIRAQLQKRLPAHMIPSAFVLLERLPLTPNGKVDRKSLPQPEASIREEADTYIAPRTSTEEVLAIIWGELLKIEQVGINDNFFLLGGHSLLATKVVARLQNVFGVKIPLRKIFEAPTVEGLAMVVDEILSSSTEDAELAALLAELEGMSEEEAERMLAE